MSKIDLFEELKNVNDEVSFIKFVGLLSFDYRENESEWQNTTIDLFLEQCEEWATESVDGLKYYSKSDNVWRRCADILYMGKIYE